MFIGVKMCVPMHQNRGPLWVLYLSRQLPPFLSHTLFFCESHPEVWWYHLFPLISHVCQSYVRPSLTNLQKIGKEVFKEIWITVGLALLSSISVDLLLASVMRLQGGCQTLNVTEMRFSWWGRGQAYYCSGWASWLSSLVSVPPFEHKELGLRRKNLS